MPLDLTRPNEITRLTLHGHNDETPDVFSADRIIQRNDGVSAPERVRLSNQEQDEAFARIQEYLTSRELTFVNSGLGELSQVPGARDTLTDSFEASEARDILSAFLAQQGLSSADVTPNHDHYFAIWHERDANMDPLTITHVVVRRHMEAGRTEIITDVTFNRLDDRLTEQFFVQMHTDIHGDDPTLYFLANDEHTSRLVALEPETRLRVYGAMRIQLLESGTENIFRTDPDDATDQG